MKSNNHLYNKIDPLYLAVDCIIFGFDGNDLKVLLIKRGFEPETGKWSLMGGFINKNESIEDGTKRVLQNLTGLKNIFMKQLYAFGETNRDPVARTVSVAYYALINIHDYDKELVKEHGASWFTINKIPQLIFDHGEMLSTAVEALKKDAKYSPVRFELLPEKFTLPQLKRLYDCIMGKNHDVRNFSKKILATGMLIKLKEKDNNSSKKGAFLYRFDKKRYKKLKDEGFLFIS
jgi:8-oxo-dGTP diphosphatase